MSIYLVDINTTTTVLSRLFSDRIVSIPLPPETRRGLSRIGPLTAQFDSSQLPLYLATRILAVDASVVPMTMTRPSGRMTIR